MNVRERKQGFQKQQPSVSLKVKKKTRSKSNQTCIFCKLIKMLFIRVAEKVNQVK